ncbi:hypothetical protein [Nonomuraea sp. NPDC049784]|uniref:hypothetical protein n=1 Tax=Nonomuraea sp. NPDC049784 TaxID=3154361 RepID=UPI0033E786D8
MPMLDLGFLVFPIPALIAVAGILAAIIIAARRARPQVLDRRTHTSRTEQPKD